MANSGALCSVYEEGKYNCICCNTPLFDSTIKFNSGTGWPSFTQPIKENAIKYEKDVSFGMVRVEVMCNTCDAHLGHVFPDGPEPSGLRYCVKKARMGIIMKKNIQTATLGGGCFWCTEAVFQEVKGVQKVVSGYAGGNVPGKPTYREVCSGLTGHAEIVQITFDSSIISYEEILVIFMTTHDPTTLNRQGADRGTQYRSVVFYHDENQKAIALEVIEQVQDYFDDKIVTEITEIPTFFEAEAEHQNYYKKHPTQGYCSFIITPKLAKLRKMHADKLVTS
ncbi:UNVERIFIED_CONTAM: hypothetical protein GTU68_032325 [Idotea baltica]|nr:hypothetical protein [Idotea baltica]